MYVCDKRMYSGHKFEPRYDLKMPASFAERLTHAPSGHLVEALKDRTYVHDICVRCGMIRTRGDK